MQENYEDVEYVHIQFHHHWESQIVPSLLALKDMKLKGSEIVELIIGFKQKYGWRRTNQVVEKKRRGDFNLRVLKSQYEGQLPDICQQLAIFLLNYKPTKIPMMYSQIKKTQSFTSLQIHYILAIMFLCLPPRQYSDHNNFLARRFCSSNDFSQVMSHSIFKTKCIVEYFKTVGRAINDPAYKLQLFTIVRNVNKKSLLEIFQEVGDRPMGKILIAKNNANIEEYVGQIKIDFANRYLGGGALNFGCVQQQIMVALRPQLYAATQLCQKMEDNEALGLIGFPRRFNSVGYSNNTAYAGQNTDQYDYDQNNQANQYIVAIDAKKYRVGDPIQFSPDTIEREVLKAYTGFSAIALDKEIVTGAWGCGAYNGDFMTKILIQWIAASLANKSMVVCPFGRKLMLENNEFMNLQQLPIRAVYHLLIEAGKLKQKVERSKSSIYSLINEIEKNFKHD